MSGDVDGGILVSWIAIAMESVQAANRLVGRVVGSACAVVKNDSYRLGLATDFVLMGHQLEDLISRL